MKQAEERLKDIKLFNDIIEESQSGDELDFSKYIQNKMASQTTKNKLPPKPKAIIIQNFTKAQEKNKKSSNMRPQTGTMKPQMTIDINLQRENINLQNTQINPLERRQNSCILQDIQSPNGEKLAYHERVMYEFKEKWMNLKSYKSYDENPSGNIKPIPQGELDSNLESFRIQASSKPPFTPKGLLDPTPRNQRPLTSKFFEEKHKKRIMSARRGSSAKNSNLISDSNSSLSKINTSSITQVQQNQLERTTIDKQNSQYKSNFPDWLKEREDFQKIKNMEYFDMNKKILSICKIQTYNRSAYEKTLIALYLEKLSLFNLMPFRLLEFIAAKIQTNSYKDGQYLCRSGDEGTCMYIIFTGNVEVIINRQVIKVFSVGQFLGRTSLDNDAKRNADLRAKGETDILILARDDYQHCLAKAMSHEKENMREFVTNLNFLENNFENNIISRLTADLRCRFLAPQDNLYKAGDKIDGIYIVKTGKLVKKLWFNINYANKHPTTQQGRVMWEKKEIQKEVQFTINFNPGDILGYYDIIESNFDQIRTETIDAVEDSFIIMIPKSQFLYAINVQQYDFFRDYHNSKHPKNYDEMLSKVREEEKQMKNSINQFELAMQQGLKSYSQDVIQRKQEKIKPVVKNFKVSKTTQFKQKIPTKVTKQSSFLLQVHDDD